MLEGSVQILSIHFKYKLCIYLHCYMLSTKDYAYNMSTFMQCSLIIFTFLPPIHLIIAGQDKFKILQLAENFSHLIAFYQRGEELILYLFCWFFDCLFNEPSYIYHTLGQVFLSRLVVHHKLNSMTTKKKIKCVRIKKGRRRQGSYQRNWWRKFNYVPIHLIKISKS